MKFFQFFTWSDIRWHFKPTCYHALHCTAGSLPINIHARIYSSKRMNNDHFIFSYQHTFIGNNSSRRVEDFWVKSRFFFCLLGCLPQWTIVVSDVIIKIPWNCAKWSSKSQKKISMQSSLYHNNSAPWCSSNTAAVAACFTKNYPRKPPPFFQKQSS